MSEDKQPEKKKRLGRPKGSTSPHLWKSGPDPEKHKHYAVYMQQKNQAQWRKEIWELSYDEWYELWGDQVGNRGRGVGKSMLFRLDKRLPWRLGNCVIMRNRDADDIL